MEHAVVFAGFGGQGILFAGRVLAHAAMSEGREVIWIPSYGPEMRGGTAACTVIISDAPIGSPVVDRLEAAVLLNPPSLEKYGPRVASGGIIVVNSTLAIAEVGRADVDEVRVACTAVAREAGDDHLVSIVALGALLARRPLVAPASVRAALQAIVGQARPEMLSADIAAFDLGVAQVAQGASPVA